MKLKLTITDANSQTVSRERDLDAGQTAALLDVFADYEGVADWLVAAFDGKTNKCTKRMAAAAIEALERKELAKDEIADFTREGLASALAKSPAYAARKNALNQPGPENTKR